MQVDVRGIPVHYEELGQGRPIVLLHGGGTDHRLMTYAFEPVFESRDGWRRIYPDLPGMGRTPGPDWIVGEDDMLAIVEDFVDAVLPGERPALVGASYGGYLALGYLHHRPDAVRGLLLVAPATRGENPQVPEHQVLERDEATVASLAEDEQFWLARSVVQRPDTLAAFRAGVLPGLRIADQAFLERLDAGPNLSIDISGPLPAPFPGPTLIVCGRQDSVVGWAQTLPLLESFPRATLAILDRAGHGVRAEQPALFRALTGEWLDRLELEERKHP